MRLRRILAAATLAIATAMGGVFIAAAPASAAAYAQAVYEPQEVNGAIEAWANVNANCEGTFGCSAYVKIEYIDNNPSRPPWINGWALIAGQWAGSGWNKVVAPSQGCGRFALPSRVSA